ncbi:hypothetical protein BH23CHL5_BH23CHL5_08350 [soil metagenome]
MSVSPFLQAIIDQFGELFGQVIEALEGVPESDLGSWRTPLAHGEINTMFGLATHIAGATSFWVLEAVGGRDQQRRRLEEFAAQGSLDSLRGRYLELMHDIEFVILAQTPEDLASTYRREANSVQGVSAAERTKASCIVHALEHVALHVGHLQLQRQLWDQEQA